MRFRAIWAAADPIPTTMTSTTVLACPVCGTIWPGPIMQAWWRANRLRWGVDLALAAGTETVHIGVGDDAARHPEMLQYAWAELESGLVERLTDRGRCMWISCTREARRWFRQDRPVAPQDRPWSADGPHLRVCREHYADLMRHPIIGPGVRILLDR